ncbi:hypothetical protein O9G_000847 [Rozella allomycis CSF55]|uniref:Uncharacterized protein n=1 Tax=Rozella allomycis (strain CSF55) TaxID=988480 RepID=A0A075AVN3_ROZAC|nr:hypothetical protein O9G_000847 [Rozella allomycis CSF55]|eukprot:EPZ32772.1 hypothetical protein O9G_000847 [Rozella allomycis CSF55]
MCLLDDEILINILLNLMKIKIDSCFEALLDLVFKWNHEEVIDWMISKETNFLEYLLKIHQNIQIKINVL